MNSSLAPDAALSPGHRPGSANRRILLERIGLRFAFVYLLLFMFLHGLRPVLFTIGTPAGLAIWRAIRTVWAPVVPWFGHHILRLAKLPGGNDSLFDYVQILCFLLIAAIAASIWAVADHDPVRNSKLHYTLRIAVRYMLAVELIYYGMDKAIPGAQFRYPPLQTLITSFGDLNRFTVFGTL